VTCPIHAEQAIPAAAIAGAIDQALREAEEQRVRGQQVTPFLLSRVAELTGGESLAANRALLLHNAAVAAAIARALAEG
jgi:pseudouridylate synthase